MAHASLGMALFREGKIEEARENLERAAQVNSQNYLIHYYYAFILSRPSGDEGNPVSSYTSAVATKIYAELQKAIALRPDFPETYNLLAFVSLVTGNKIDEAMTLLKKAISASPGRNDLSLMLAQLYLRQNDYKTARLMLEHVARSSAEGDVRQHAQALLAQVTSYEQQLEIYETQRKERAETRKKVPTPEPSPSTNRTVDVTSAPASSQDPSAYLREVLRQPAAGETQLQGILLKIECQPKNIVFFVKVGEQILRLKSRDFEDLDITTYDPEVHGEITCGARKSEERVIICFVPQSDKRVKIDGMLRSIEFVPKDFKLKPTE
jgi:Tfp pilus assembly protein PilF